MSERSTAISTRTQTLSDGRTLAYTTSGDPDGFPVVVHHGTPGSRLFATLLSDLATTEGVRLVVPDRPGYGRSTSPPRDWTWRDWRQDLTELLHARSIDRAALMGFSGGGPFALAAGKIDCTSRVGVVSTVVPPAETGLAKLSTVPFALRVLFGLSKALAVVAGPEAVVKQYTDRAVSESMSQAIADDFHEALRRDARAVTRENRTFARNSLAPTELSVPVRAWHGTHDENAPLPPVEDFLAETDGMLVSSETDHLGTLLDHRSDVFDWLSPD